MSRLSCPDHETRRVKCKHIHAVGSQASVANAPATEPWPSPDCPSHLRPELAAYNAAQTNEKERVTELLRGVCDRFPAPARPGPWRLPLSDVVFSAVMKVFTTVSGRRATCDLRECETKGHVSRAPHYNSIFNYLENQP